MDITPINKAVAYTLKLSPEDRHILIDEIDYLESMDRLNNCSVLRELGDRLGNA